VHEGEQVQADDADEGHRQDQGRADQVGGDHDGPPRQPVRDHAAERCGEDRRHQPEDQHHGDRGLVAVGEREGRGDEGEGGDPVAE